MGTICTHRDTQINPKGIYSVATYAGEPLKKMLFCIRLEKKSR